MALHTFVSTFLPILLLSGCGSGAATPADDASQMAESPDASALFRRGQEAAALGDTVRAEQYLSMALERGYSEKRVLPIMLRVCLSSSRLRAALNHAEPYLREHPNDQGLRYLVATIHLSLGQLDEARIELNHLLRINRSNGRAHYLLGVLESGANGEQASEHFRKYLELAPSGEHAVEVKSRMTDLDVRVDLYSKPTGRNGFVAIRHAEPTPTEPRTPQPEGAVWFGDTQETAATPPVKAGEP